MRVPDLPLHPTGPPPPTGPPLPPPGPQPPPGAPAVSVVPPMPKTSPTALIALVLAALSFLYCPVVFAVVALVLARQAETDIAESHGWATGSGLVTGAGWRPGSTSGCRQWCWSASRWSSRWHRARAER